VNGIEGVVLAAGLSSRSGAFKMTLPLGDSTVIGCSVGGMLPFVERVHVVVGWNADRVREALAGLKRVALVHNAEYRAGMYSSVRVGIACVRAERFLLLPGDMPLVGPEVYRRLFAAKGEIVVPICRGRRGHPVLFHSALVPAILSTPEDATLRDFVDDRGYTMVEVDDEGILIDVDTPEDYAAALARAASNGRARSVDAT